MLPSINLYRLKPYGLAVMLLASLVLLTGATRYFTPSRESTPISAPTPPPATPPAEPPISAGIQSEQSIVPASSNFAPFLHIVPDQNGTYLFIRADSSEVGGTVTANVNVGGGHYKGGTMVYSNTVQAYVTTLDPDGLTANSSHQGNIFITSTLGLNTELVQFNRAYIPFASTPTINSEDGLLQLTLLRTDTFSAEAYIVVVPSYSHPGAASSGNNFASRSYSVRASGGLVTANQPMNLQITYNEVLLGGASPNGLAIFAWDAFNKRWDRLGGVVDQNSKSVSVSTSRFTTYSLQVTRQVHLPVIFK